MLDGGEPENRAIAVNGLSKPKLPKFPDCRIFAKWSILSIFSAKLFGKFISGLEYRSIEYSMETKILTTRPVSDLKKKLSI